MLLGGDAGERLEPVREMGGAVLDGPILQRGGHAVGGREVERLASRDRASERLVDRLREAGLLGLVAEDATAEDLRGAAVDGYLPPFGDCPIPDRLDCFT